MQCGLHDMAPETALDQCGVTSKQLVGLYECLTKAGRQVPAPLDLMLYTLKELKEMEIPARAEGDADVGPCVAVPFLEMQESYVLGRRTPALGPCQIYTEVLFKDIDLQALQAAVQRVAQAEPMLRATCQASGQMQEIREDLHWQLEVEEDSSLARARWSRPLPEGRFWALGASRCSGQVQLHLKVDMTFLDAESWLIVCCKVATGYRPTTSLPPSPDPSHEFFRYCATQQRGGLGEVEWKEKLKDLPLGPALPWCSRMGQGQAYAFGRVPLCVLREQWEDLKQHAKELGVSCTQLLITYFQDAIAFSSDASFTLTATVSRRPNHLKGCLGEFTNVALLSCNAESLQQERGVRAKNIQQQLLTQLAPGHITGMQIMRLWREIRREEVVLPVVLTSLLDLEHAQPISFGEERATVVYQRTQTPAVRLDVQFFEVQNELCVNFDYDERWLSEDVVKQLAKSFEEALAGEKLSVLHGGRLDTQAYNHSLLHELAFADLDAKKDLPALRSPQHTLSYDDLDRVTNYLANELTMIWNNQGVRSNFCDVRVAVALEKGWEQVVACLGVLRSGACYVPLELSDCRWKKVLSSADCSLALIKEGCDVRQETDTKCQCLEIGEVWLERARTAECKHIQAQPRGCDAAYIIFTSGTTGEPKGVVISHKSACNTCISVSHLLKLTKDDRVLALSNLNFDLSVYDIFGTLAAGACIVMCKQDDLKRYLNLCKVVSKEHVTIWNSVPLRFQLLVDEWCDSYFMPIRAALISGDAIQTSFARKVKRRFPALQFLALGGATEASIWSNFHEFTEASPDLPLVLYGKPLTNQQMYVLDSQMRIRPAYVPGEIFIGGSGVAKEYFRDQQRTAKSFLEHREYGRLYKTGDMGCYLPSGEIQIMGRLDQQVKVDGYRVELAEIEAAAHEILPKQVRVIVAAEKGQGVILRGFLCGQCPELNMAELKQMLQDGLKERLPIYMRPRTWSTAQNLPQGANGKVDRQKLLESRAPEAQFASAVHVASAEELLRITQGVLSNPDLAMDADLAEAGMNSLRARDLHIAILKAFGVNVPSYAVFDHFTVRALARAFLNPAGAGGVESPVLEALPSLQPKRQRSVVQGVGMCLPGGFFELHQGINCVTTVPLLRFDVDEYFSPDMEIGKTYTRHGSFIPSLGWFDSDAFPLSEHEVAAMDPQQRLALQVAAMAMGPQATGPSRGSVGVYAGQMDYDWMVSSKAPAPYGSTGVAPSITANRISFVFDLRGPSMTIDTACSASLTAAHQAMQAMNDGPGAALVVGTHVLLAPDMYLHACKAKMLSPKGRCATFDQSADGFVRGEGVASMFLVLDPDIALCQVLGTASNQNGRSAGLTKPKSDAQKVVIGEGLRRAGVDGCAVLVHELHGTGTRLGDPLEAEAVRAMLGESLVLQALKTHFGHLEGAAGIAGLMKQVALLQSLAATPNLHLYKLNDEVALAKDAKHVLEVVDLSATSPWTCAASRYVASVSSFGFGGSNAFAVLEAMQPVEAGKKAWKDLSTAAAALRSGPKKYFALIEHDVQRTKWMELKDGLCRVTAQLCTYKPSMGQADLATAKDNARLLAVACWPSEQQQTSLQIIERCSAFVLKTLQKAGEEPGAWRLLVAGRGQAAEACFAAAASMLRSAQGEQELRVQVVHLPASSWAEVEAALAEHSGLKLPPVSEEPVCRVRPEGVLVPRLERWRPDRQPGVSVRLGGRYVITGGSGALARVCAEWLLGRGAAAVTLLSRSCPGYLEHDRRLHWLRCDVSVAGELRNAIQAIREKGKVHGVMHAAGVLADAMLVNQSEELLRRAFGPKILPALLLPELEPSDWLVMFSSAAVLGSPGQCAYAAANAAMDGLVSASDSGSGARMLSVQWGPWTEGMATQVKGALARAAERGWAPLPRNMGLAILELLLDSGATGVLCAVHRSEEVPAAAPAPKVLQSKTFSDLDVLSIVRAHVAELVSKRSCGGPLQELGDSAPILEGLESLETEELHAALQKTFNIRLLQGTVINHPTIKQLAHCIGDSLRNDTDLNLKSTAADGPMTWAELPGAPDRKGCLTLFLIGGAAGDVRKSFGEFASFYPGRVFAAMPPRRRGVSMKDILEELGPSLGTRSGGQPFMLGGLSFGATVALELLRVRYAKGALGIIVFDPRNLPPYSTAALPRDPLWYETLCSRMEAPKLPIPGIHILARLGSYHGDGFKAPAAEGFQNDEEVRERVRCIFPHGLSTVPVDADHFEFLSDSHAKALAQHLGQLAMHGPKLLEADLRPPPKISLEVACMACDLPSARGASALLVDAVTQIPFSRMDLESSQIYTKHGACMAEVEWFDHQHFGIKAAEAWVMDPQQRLLLQQACMVLQACEKETGVWIGQANHDWLSLRGWEACPFSAGGSSPAISANRVNYVFNLLGPSASVDTACSSSLVAFSQARNALDLEKCSRALVGGTHVFADPGMFRAACSTKALSQSGRCRTLDASADGYCRGEGVAALVLQPAAGDAGVTAAAVPATATNHNGHSASLTAPSGPAQQELMREALRMASAKGADVGFVELHGTGTKLGDPIEAQSTLAVFSRSEQSACLVLGAVKTNMGHLEGSAGMAGLFKLMATLRRRVAMPNLHIRQLNAHLRELNDSSFFPDALMACRAQLGAVSSFGFGGSNAQVLLQQLEADPQAARVQTPPTVCWHGRQGAFFDIPGTPSVLHTTRWQSAPCAAASVPIMLASKQVFRGMAREWSADGVRLLAMKCWDREIAEEAEGDQQQTSLQIIERCSAFVLKTLQKAGEEPGAWRLLVAGRGQAAEACFAAAASMLRSAQGEQELRVQVVHLPASSWAEVEAALAEHSDLKLPPVSDEPVCRVSPESILVPRLERWRPDRQPGVSVRLDGRYVITGGSGSLARVCAEWLLSRGATSVTLLSRSCPGYLEDDRRLHWLRCDVSVAGELRSAIQAIRDKGEVHGVMHAAGVLADAMLANQSEELLRRAFGPKILPALLLPELEPSDWLVMFSSAAVLGSPGQCAYAAANAAMDGLVSASDSGSGARMLSVQWGPWSEVGMAASQDVLGRAERHGFGAFTNRQGIDVLDHLLSHGALGCVCAARGDLAHVPSASAKAPDNRGPTPELGVLIRRLVAELTSQEETEVSVDAELVDIGLDSLGAANLSQGLSKELGVKVLPTLASEASTVRDLEQVLARELAAVPLMGDFEAATSKLPTLVVGAGVGGVIFAQQLHMARENVIVMEKGDQPGGSWHLGNSSSRLQIDSPSYMLNYEQQFNLPAYPSKEQILTEVRNAAKVLPDVRLGHRVTSVKTLQRGQYQVSFMNQLEEEQSMTVGGVAFFLGGLHHPRNVNYPGEERFTGKIGLGHKDDVDPGFFKDKEVVIVGHGAFAVENMRTALQQGAKRVTMVARRRNVVFPTVVNWLINSVHSTLSIREIRPILASFYQSVGLTLDDLPALKEDSIDFRIPPCSDIYFLAQAMGKLKVVIGEVKRVKEGAVVVQEGDTQQVIECTRLLKCIGFLHAPCVEQILGRPLEQVASFWIDGDVNLVANDQFQVPERVSSLLCPSYSFYVHSFANAFLSYRKNPQALEALSKSTNLSPHDAVTVMWQHFKAMKEKVARLTSEHLPFWRFVAQRREEWQSNAQLLNPDFQGVPNLDDLLRPASSKAAQLWPYEPQDVAGVLAPARRPRVLFFHGQKTDRLVAIELLKAQGWWQQNLDFVIPDGPHVVEADADPEQLQRVGLTQLVASKKYRPGAAYKEWPSNFQMFFDLHMGNMSKTEIERAAEAESRRYSEAFHYLKEVSTRFGPFDGVAGFCQGAAFAQVALCQQRAGHDLGLQDVRMMIAMAPWRCPYHEHLERVGQFDSKLEMPLLLMHGRQDLDMFKEAIPAFSKSFREARVVAFEGAHAYPPLARSPDLRAEVQRFLNESQRRF
ncbi:unnamed protein product [Effrenium voratum]|uniref:Uncharacterized protein n=1 Tax=Effrenium voratum TaxID=2562239 RepID=A0AA36HW94_9DINO|nr:unnamed protein product [Effrenium voratum]